MIIRSVHLEGTVADGDRDAFDAHLRGPVSQALRTYPGLRQLRLRRLVRGEEGAPAVYLAFDLYFDCLQAMDSALASPTRQAVRDAMVAARGLWTGRIFHLVYEET